MNLIQLIDCWRTNDGFSWNNFYFIVLKNFDMAKNIRGFWRIYLNVIFWISLWLLTSLAIWNLNITVSTTLKFCYKKALNKKLKLMGGARKYFPKKILGHEIFRSMVSWATNLFWKMCKTLRSSPSNILNVRSLLM